MEIPVYSGNSDKQKEKKNAAPPERKAAVISGPTHEKKKSKIASALISDEAKNVRPHVVNEVVIPKLKEMVFYAITDALQMTLGINAKGFVKNFVGGGSKASYTQYFSNQPTTAAKMTSEPRDAFEYNNIAFESRSDAEAVLDAMWEIVNSQYGSVSILDFYDLSQHPTNNYNLANYGWRDLTGTRVVRTMEGFYALTLPRCVPLK